MKYIFVINPEAGIDRKKTWLFDSIEKASSKLSIESEIYLTKGFLDAAEFTKRLGQTGEAARIWACGGDGTLNECAAGAAGFENLSVGCVPCGTGNDFIKYFGGAEPFLSIERQLTAPVHPVDLLRAGETFSINIINAGFDAGVAHRMKFFKRIPGLSGLSYHLAVVASLLGQVGFTADISVDGGEKRRKKLMLLVAANGSHYGGGYNPAPKAVVDDGLIELCLVNSVSRFKIAELIGAYKNGKHLDNPRFENIIEYIQCRSVSIESKNRFFVCRDGEVSPENDFEIGIVPGGLNFINPSAAPDSLIQDFSFIKHEKEMQNVNT